MGKWYLVHIGIQALGLVVALASFLIAVTQFNPIPRSLGHFELGLTVMIIALLQPLNSLPRLTMHHVRSPRSEPTSSVRSDLAEAVPSIWLLSGCGTCHCWKGMFERTGAPATVGLQHCAASCSWQVWAAGQPVLYSQ